MTKDQVATAGSFLVLVRNFPGTALLLGKELFDLIAIAQKVYSGKAASNTDMIKVAKATTQMCDMLG